jgi:hypothetical protein
LNPPRIFWLTALMLLASTAVSYGFEGFWTITGMQYPYTSPLVGRISYFDDLLDWVGHMHLIHTSAYLYTPGMVSYTAPGMVLYWLLSLAGSHALAAYMVMVGVLVGVALLALGRQLRRAGIETRAMLIFLGIVVLTSYPLLFTITTANLEIAVWALIVVSVWAYATGRHGVAATMIGVAVGIKFYPALLLLLYLRKRDWLRIVQAGASAIAVTAASLWIVYPKFNESWNAIYGGAGTTASFVKDDVLRYAPGRSGFDHALWELYKVLTSPFTYSHTATELVVVSVLASAVVLGLWLWRVQRMELWEQMTFLGSAMLLVMPMSNDYRLMTLYVPFGLFLLAMVRNRAQSGMAVAVAALYALLLTPQGYANWDGIRYAAQVKCFMLMGLLAIVTICGKRIEEQTHAS